MYRSLQGIIRSAVAVATAALILAPAAGAQRSSTSSKPAARKPVVKERTSKWVFGAHTIAAPGVSITGQDIDGTFGTGMGGGIGIMAGYELNRAITGFASMDVARQNSGVNWMQGSFGLVHAELGVRARISQSNPQSVPYFTAAIGRRALGARITDLEDDEVHDMSLTGTMLSLGGGLQYQLSPKVSLDGGAEFAIGAFDHIDDDGELWTLNVNSTTSIRLRAGFTWRP
jgi:opacity protein-like surface antigen